MRLVSVLLALHCSVGSCFLFSNSVLRVCGTSNFQGIKSCVCKSALKYGRLDVSAPSGIYIDKLDKEAENFIVNTRTEFSVTVSTDDPYDKPVIKTEWSGQSGLDVVKASHRNWSDLVNRCGLAFTDALALILFAFVGRMSHNEGFDPVMDLLTAAPFLLAWFALSPFAGAYSRNATASAKRAASSLLLPWAISMPAGLLIRGLGKGAISPTPFIVVSLVATFLALWLARCVYIALVGSTSDEASREAGLLEVFTMLRTLVRRW